MGISDDENIDFIGKRARCLQNSYPEEHSLVVDILSKREQDLYGASSFNNAVTACQRPVHQTALAYNTFLYFELNPELKLKNVLGDFPKQPVCSGNVTPRPKNHDDLDSKSSPEDLTKASSTASAKWWTEAIENAEKVVKFEKPDHDFDFFGRKRRRRDVKKETKPNDLKRAEKVLNRYTWHPKENFPQRDQSEEAQEME